MTLTDRQISERKNHPPAMALNDFDFRLLKAIGQAAIVTDLDGVVIFWNAEAEKLYLWTADEAVGHSVFDLLLNGLVIDEANEIMEQHRQGKSWNGDFSVRRKDGNMLPIALTNTPIFNSSGALTGILGLSQDITERKRSEKVLVNNEASYRYLLEQASDGIHTYNTDGWFIDANARFCEMLGYSSSELTNIRVQDLVPADDLAKDPIRFSALLSGDTILNERRLRRKDGTIFTAEISGKLISGGILQGIIRDVSERKKTESVLDAQKQALEMIVTDAPLDSVLIFLTRVVEKLSNETSVASILILDDQQRLRNGASPSLPDEYIAAVDGLKADINVGTCCAAAASGKVVVTPDILHDVKWEGLAHLPLELGLKAAWSMPILARDGRVLGTFGTYFREVREPYAFEKQVVEILARTAALAIERKDTDEKLRQGEERLSAIFEASPDGIIVEESETIVYVNRSYLHQFGYNLPQEVIGRNISILISPADRSRVMEFGRCRERGEPAPAKYEFKGIRKDGTLIEVEASVSTSVAGPHKYTTTMIRDVTERNRTQEALLSSENQLRLVTDAIPLLVALIDDQQRYQFVNRSYTEWFNRSREDVIGKHISEILGDAAYIELLPEIEKVLAGDEVVFERSISYGTGERFIHVNYIPQKDRLTGTITGFHSFVSDISGRKAAERALEISKGELEDRVVARTSELEAANKERIRILHQLVTAQENERGRIARDLHDHLGQQMTVLRLKLEAIKIAADSSDEMTWWFEEIHDIAQQLDADVDFLAWKFRPVVLDDLGIVAALDNYIKQWSKHFGISSRFEAKRFGNMRLDPDVETNFYRITQEALTNVSKHANAKLVNVLLEPRKGGTVLIIEDDGIGFEPSRSTSIEKGMGLVGMKERASLIGGNLEIESSVGAGTTIFVRVPAV